MAGEMMLFPDTVEEFMEQYKVVDRDHAISNGAEFIPVFRMRQWFEHLQAPTTNADRICAMSDEELAEWFCTMCNWGDLCPYRDECDPGEEHSGAIKWLKRRAE